MVTIEAAPNPKMSSFKRRSASGVDNSGLDKFIAQQNQENSIAIVNRQSSTKIVMTTDSKISTGLLEKRQPVRIIDWNSTANSRVARIESAISNKAQEFDALYTRMGQAAMAACTPMDGQHGNLQKSKNVLNNSSGVFNYGTINFGVTKHAEGNHGHCEKCGGDMNNGVCGKCS